MMSQKRKQKCFTATGFLSYIYTNIDLMFYTESGAERWSDNLSVTFFFLQTTALMIGFMLILDTCTNYYIDHYIPAHQIVLLEHNKLSLLWMDPVWLQLYSELFCPKEQQDAQLTQQRLSDFAGWTDMWQPFSDRCVEVSQKEKKQN